MQLMDFLQLENTDMAKVEIWLYNPFAKSDLRIYKGDVYDAKEDRYVKICAEAEIEAWHIYRGYLILKCE